MKSKGEMFGYSCARTVCAVIVGAWWWNSSMRRWYCQPCAAKINTYAPGLCVKAEDSKHAERRESGAA